MSERKVGTPATPLHPNADSEVNLKEIARLEPQDFNLDLNSDMSDDDDGIEFENVETSQKQGHISKQEHVNPLINDLKEEDRYGGLMGSASVTSLRELNDLKEFATLEELDDGGFTDIETPRNTPINPFKDADSRYHELEEKLKLQPKPNRQLSENGKLSLAQQSRFVQYIDNRLLQIQRNFIKFLSADEVVTNVPGDNDDDINMQEEESFTLNKLLAELSTVLDFIWYSIFETKTIPLISSKLSMSQAIEPPIVHPSRLFGQTGYIIKIMGDVTDYITKYNFEEWHDLTDLLQFLKKIDSFVSILIDQTEENNYSLIDNTERVRIDSIITRTKMVTLEKFEHMKFKLVSTTDLQQLGSKRKHDEKNLEPTQVENILHKYEEKIGEVYEGIIDRTSI